MHCAERMRLWQAKSIGPRCSRYLLNADRSIFAVTTGGAAPEWERLRTLSPDQFVATIVICSDDGDFVAQPTEQPPSVTKLPKRHRQLAACGSAANFAGDGEHPANLNCGCARIFD
jgi:hypothetical protein